MDTFVSTEWLAATLSAPDLVVLDGSWYLPDMKRDARAEYAAGHIPGGVFFDLDAMSEQATTLPHMLPKPEVFARNVSALGVGSDNRIVVYDGWGLFSAPRVAWMFRVMGHDHVAVLDGGLPKWKAEGRPLEAAARTRSPARFVSKFRPETVKDLDTVRENIRSRTFQVADARGAPRFTATEPEPRAGIRGGHIPGSRNLHYAKLVAPDGTLKPSAEIARLAKDSGLDLAKPIVTSCGSGVTAAVILLALERAGAKNLALYDGSWAEWGARTDTPIETG